MKDGNQARESKLKFSSHLEKVTNTLNKYNIKFN